MCKLTENGLLKWKTFDNLHMPRGGLNFTAAAANNRKTIRFMQTAMGEKVAGVVNKIKDDKVIYRKGTTGIIFTTQFRCSE